MDSAKEKDDGEIDCRGRVTVLHNATIVTMDPDSRVFRNGALVVVGDVIHAIGHSSQILHDHSHLADDVIDLGSRFLLPGFVNTHVHTSQQLARGIADDVDLMTWLHERIWPYESNMTEEDSYLSTLLCGIELIHSGVTCFAEAGGQHVSGMAKAVELLGIRACLTQSTMDSGHGLPPVWNTHSTDYCIESQKSLYKKHHKTANGRIRIWFGLRQIMNASDRLLIETRDIAKELKTGIHMHVAEISYENELVVKTRDVDHGTVTYLQKLGLLQDNLLAAHSVWVNETEIGFLSKAGVKVSHCPAAAMRMLGFAPIKEMLDVGICVSLGTDGAPSNNRMSIASVITTSAHSTIGGGIARGPAPTSPLQSIQTSEEDVVNCSFNAQDNMDVAVEQRHRETTATVSPPYSSSLFSSSTLSGPFSSFVSFRKRKEKDKK